jgi:hypothetical protein
VRVNVPDREHAERRDEQQSDGEDDQAHRSLSTPDASPGAWSRAA